MSKHRPAGGGVKYWGVAVLRRRGVLHAIGERGRPLCGRVSAVQLMPASLLANDVRVCTACVRRAGVLPAVYALATAGGHFPVSVATSPEQKPCDSKAAWFPRKVVHRAGSSTTAGTQASAGQLELFAKSVAFASTDSDAATVDFQPNRVAR